MPFPLAYRLIGMRHARRARRRTEDLAREGLGTPLTAQHLATWRTSDTLFVLGSGASINELTAEQWREIAQADSIGFNFWPLHEFVPTFYVFEQPGFEERARLLFDLLESRAADYGRTRVVAKSLAKFRAEAFPRALRPNLYLSADYSLPAQDEAGLRRALAYIARRGLLRDPSAIDAIPFKRASVSYLVFWALIAGYRRIVLCGIDLNHSRYFYEDRADRYPPALLPDRSEWGTTHRTLDHRVDELTVDKVIYAIDDVLLRPTGIELFVARPSSALHPRLPCYFAAGQPGSSRSVESPA